MSLLIKNGAVMIYYCFDIANEIHLDRVETVFGKKPKESKLDFSRITPSYVQYRAPPLLVKLGEKNINNKKFVVEAKIYDFGVVSIRFWTPVSGSMDMLKKITSSFSMENWLEKEARNYLEKLKCEIETAIDKHHTIVKEFAEDYIIVEVNKFNIPVTAKELVENHRQEIGQMLRCEKTELDESQIADSLKQPLSYSKKDLVLIDWNAAFIYDTKHNYDVIDIIEYAVIELLELRTYDSVLDAVLDKAYTDVLKKKKGFSLSPYSKTMDYLVEVKLEISDIIEKVENSLKLVGDIYLAKVYAVTAERFYHEKWRKSVEKKMETVEHIYSTTTGRMWDRKLLLVEIFMTLFFVLWFVTELAIFFAAGK